MLRIYLTLLVLLFSFTEVCSQPNPLNEISIGLKAYAMGKTSGISFIEANSIILNPSIINLKHETSFSVYYSNYADHQNTFNLAGYIPLKNIGNLAIAYQNLSVGNIPKVDQDGIKVSSFTAISEQATLAYSKSFFDQITFGICGKWYHSYFTLDELDYDYNRIGMDIGLSYDPQFDIEPLEGLSAGIVVYNLFISSDGTYKPKKEYRFILEKFHQVDDFKLTGIANLYYYQTYPDDLYHRIQLGLNADYKNIDFSIGYYTNFYAAGIGFVYGKLNFGYVYGVHHSNNYHQHNHGISIGVNF